MSSRPWTPRSGEITAGTVWRASVCQVSSNRRPPAPGRAASAIRVMPRRTGSYLSRSRCVSTAWADWREISYSVEEPPNRTANVIFFMGEHLRQNGSRLFFYYRGSISGVSDFQPTKGLQSSEPNLKKSSQKAYGLRPYRFLSFCGSLYTVADVFGGVATPSTMSRAASPTPRVTSLAASPASRAASRAVEPPSSGVRYSGAGVVVLGAAGCSPAWCWAGR